MDKETKFLVDLIAKCHSTSTNAVTFASTRLRRHARLFPTRIAMRTVELSVGILTALDRLDKLEDDDATTCTDDTTAATPSTTPNNSTTTPAHRHAALVTAYDALDLVDRFINVFRPVSRLEYFAEEKTLENGWMTALSTIEHAQQHLIQVLRTKEQHSLALGSSFDVLEAEEASNGHGTSTSRMIQCFDSLKEATQHVWGPAEYTYCIEFDVERKRNQKIKTLLDDIRHISAADKKADTSQSIEQMLDATSVFDAFVRQFSLGSIMDKLAKKTKSSRDEIGDTIKGHWETLGFDMDDDRAYEMIELFLINNNKSRNKDDDDDGPSLDSATRPSIFCNVGYLGTLDDIPDLVRITKQTSRSPEPIDSTLYPNRSITLPDFEGPSSLQLQYNLFQNNLVQLFRLLKLDGCWVWDGEALFPVWDGPSLWKAVKSSLPPPPTKAKKGGVSLEDDSEEDSEEEQEDTGHHDNPNSNTHNQHQIFVKEGCVLFVAGRYEPTATLIGARHMPSTDDLKTIIVSLATLSANIQTVHSACMLLHYLLTEAPRAVVAARSHYVWRCGGLILLLQATQTFRKGK